MTACEAPLLRGVLDTQTLQDTLLTTSPQLTCITVKLLLDKTLHNEEDGDLYLSSVFCFWTRNFPVTL